MNHRLLVSPMQNVVAINCHAPDPLSKCLIGMLVVEAGASDATVLVTPPRGGGEEFWLTLPEAVLNQGQRYVGFQISTPIRAFT